MNTLRTCHYLLYLGGLLIGLQTAWAQTGPVTITGTVVDSASRKKLDLVTVKLMDEKNAVVNAAYTKSDGSFLFSGLQPLSYSLVLSRVGYTSQTIGPVGPVDSTRQQLDLGLIPMRQEAVVLEEVKISTAKQIVRQEVDRISYDTQADPESKALNVLEMMRKVPLLSLDADDNIRLKGQGDFKILINGKPSSMVERSYKEILRSMPASSIQRIEVITTPSAKYDAEGLGGIINIITNKKIDAGYTGSLQVSERFPVGGPGLGGSFSAKLGKWGMSGFGGASIYNTPLTTTLIDRITFGDAPTQLAQNNTTKSGSRSGYFGYEVSLELDSLNLISAQVNFNGNHSDGTTDQHILLQGTNTFLQRYKLINNSFGGGNGFDAAVNYQLGFKADKNRLLTFSYRYFRSGSEQTNSLVHSDRLNYTQPDFRQLNDQHFSEQTFQLDYVYPLRKLTIEAGIKAISRVNSSDFQYRSYNALTAQFDLDRLLSNQFENTQRVYSIYNSVQYSLKTWSIKGGLRLEQTVMRADFISTESNLDKTYFNVIPSVAIQKNLKKGSALNLSFSQRIQRPGINQLNPFVDRSNPNFQRSGNPDLAPQTGGDLQLGYSWARKVSVNAGVGFSFRSHMIFPVTVYDSATQITRATYKNAGHGRLPQLNLTVNYPITSKWNVGVNGRTAYAMIDGLVNSTPIRTTGFMYNITVSSGYRFGKSWRLNANLNASGPDIDLQAKSNTMVSSSFTMSKEVIADKLTFSAGLANPFAPFRHFQRETFGPDFVQWYDRKDYFRAVNVNLNYKFGKLKEAIKKNKRSIRNDDID